MYERDDSWEGFTWLNVDNAQQSSLAFLRRGDREGDVCVCALNFTLVPVKGFVMGLPWDGVLTEVLCSEDEEFGGKGGSRGKVTAARKESFGEFPFSAAVDLPPLCALYYKLSDKTCKRGEDV